ncbi:MAG: LacI family DNA-binding transcriptional regulator [Planctomycetota bacterium]|jgi:DNA-binding LacI/PurR family transcriptional regulator
MAKKEDQTIAVIAEKCGVSVMTVSRALRGQSSVKQQTKEMILKTAESIGYVRNPNMGRPAQQTIEEKSKVELILGTAGRGVSVFHSKLIESIEQQLAQTNSECLIRICTGEYQQFVQLLENVRQSENDAAMLIGSFPAEQLKSLLEAIPGALLVDNPGDPEVEKQYESFCFDNVEAARLGIRHLMSENRKKILIVTGMKEHFFAKEVVQGYKEVLSNAKIKVNKDLICYTDFTPESAYESVKQLFEKDIEFDAVFTNDEMASGVYRAILERGLSIPGDIAVCGCDGLPVGMHLFPQLSTIKLDYEDLGRRAINHLMHERGKSRTVCRLRLLPELEIRESS